MGDIVYPTRCRVIDPAGARVGPFAAQAPRKSQPHIGKCGVAEELPDGRNVKLTLDDGTVLMDYDCWWVPIDADGNCTYDVNDE